MVRLIKECNSLKERLSANKDVQIQIIGLYDNQDFKSSMTRTLFEELAEQILQNLMTPVQEVLRKSGLNYSDVN